MEPMTTPPIVASFTVAGSPFFRPAVSAMRVLGLRFRRSRAAELVVDAVDASGALVRLDADGEVAVRLSDLAPHGVVTVRGSREPAPRGSTCECPRVHVHEVLDRGEPAGQGMAVLAW